MMLFHPDRVEPQLLGPGDLLERLPVVVAAFDGNEPDLESCHGLRPRRSPANSRERTRPSRSGASSLLNRLLQTASASPAGASRSAGVGGQYATPFPTARRPGC